MKKNLKIVVLLALFITITTGCFQKHEKVSIPTEDEVKEYIKEKYGENNKIVSKKEIKAKKTKDEKIVEGYKYTIQSDLGFEYEVIAGIKFSYKGNWGKKVYVKNYSDNFYVNFEEKKQNELDTIIKKDSNYKMTYHISKNELCKDEDYKYIDSGLRIDIDLMDDANNIESSIDDLYKIKNELKEKYNITDQKIFITIVLNKESVYSAFDDLYQFDKNIYVELVKRKFKKDIPELNFSFDNPTYINKLFINGEEIGNADKFIYDPVHKEYLVSLNRTGAEYHFTKKIVTDYLNGTYKIKAKDSNPYYPSYNYKIKIKDNEYEVYLSFNDSKLENNYYFKKNGENMNIEIITTAFNNIDYFIKLSDWASLLDCNYEIKDGDVYLTSK